MKFISFDVLELQQNTKEARIVSRKDRKRHAKCIEESVNYGKQYKPEGSEILKDSDAKITKKTSKTLEKPQDVTRIYMKGNSTKPAVSSFGELYSVGFCFVLKWP